MRHAVYTVKSPALAVCFCLHDDHWYLSQAAQSVASFGKCFAFVSRLAWNGSIGDWQTAVRVAKDAGLEVVLGDWADEQCHRQDALKHLKELGFKFTLVPDGDEIYEPSLIEALRGIAKADLADQVHVHMDTYWKSPEYVIRPRERITPVALVNLDRAKHVYIRHYEGGRQLVLGPEYGVMHHLSYAGPDERIQRKLATWGHKDEVVPNWFEQVYKGWDADPLMRNLHPTHPAAYGFIERIEVPNVLTQVPRFAPTIEPISTSLKRWPTISVVIPLYGHPEDIRLCLESLARIEDLLHEVIVVDNGSKDGADQVAESFPFAILLRNETNLGFAKASNQGVEASTGEIILYLNSDTVLPRSGLVRMIESLMRSATIAASGPFTNECGHSQRIEPTYQSLATLDLFADQFATRVSEDIDAPADMLVAFCMAVRRSVLDEIGGFDEAFGLGSFEDNDLCYRLKRAGYRLVISTRAFVHHTGSRTFGSLGQNPFRILAENEKRFRAKWKDDLESGYASHLSGLTAGHIVFDANRSPEQRVKSIKPLVDQADISLCMIVKNEERVLADCLKSAQPFFKQIVIVDTGSTDRTIEIARSFGAEVHEMEWPDSFSAARNESLRHARGKWIFWMDADDTLPWNCGEQLLECAIQAPPEIAAFLVAVQFVEDTPNMGTRVDHVKLFRNGKGIHFDGRIHEQNIASIRATGGEIARTQAFVFHSGYDTTKRGQEGKRVRDEKLLKLDLADDPKHPFKNFNMGMTCHYCGQHDEAIEWLDKSIELAADGESHLRKAYALKSMSLFHLGRSGEALSAALRGLQVVGDDAELHFRAGYILAHMGRHEEAKQHYLAVENDRQDHFDSLNVGILGCHRFLNLGGICMQQGNYPEARQWFLKSLESNPQFLQSALSLFDAAMQHSDAQMAQLALQHIQAVAGKSEDWVNLQVAYHESWGGLQASEMFLRQEVTVSPRASAVRLALARKLLSQGREAEAAGHLQELVKQGVAEAAFFLGIFANRRGDLQSALHWMEHAHVLEPEHEETVRQIEALVKAIKTSKN